MKTIKHPKSENYFELKKEFPEFSYPTDEQFANLKKGDVIKIGVSGETFWLEVKRLYKNKIIARVDNDLVRSDIHDLFFNDIVSIHKHNIRTIKHY